MEKAAERVFSDTQKGKAERKNEAENFSVEETAKNMRQRMEMNKERYRKLYNVDYLDEKNYDIVVDTTENSIDVTKEKVLEQIKKLKNN